MSTSAPRVRRSLTDIQADYDNGNKTELENLMRAWKGIQSLPSLDPRSFFILGGYHGEPFRGPGATNPNWWGGYCQHGTVLFPSWHRAYMNEVELALRSIPGCEDVTLPFWDECSAESRQSGIPTALTDETFVLDGVEIPNPLKSFAMPEAITDDVQGDNNIYSKPLGYKTVRYPLSGLVGTPADQAATAAHNAPYNDPAVALSVLNKNIVAWLNLPVPIENRAGTGVNTLGQIFSRFVKCLDAPNYTLFSNTTSAGNWNGLYPNNRVTALENPHNYMHLAVGGFDVPGQDPLSVIPDANGDMGENDTAALDPIFFFHHCFIDYVFWTWQRKNGATQSFAINGADPGAVYGSQNPPPADGTPNTPIDMNTPLNPFKNADGSPSRTIDVVDIEGQLGYTYGPGSLDGYIVTQNLKAAALAEPAADDRTIHVEGIDRTNIRGSFLIAAYADIDGERRLVGVEPVLSRWQVEGCANCQTHLKTSADFTLPGGGENVEVALHTRAGVVGSAGPEDAIGAGGLKSVMAELAAKPAPSFIVEIR